MIETFYGLGALDSGTAFFAALAIGLFFGLALERSGFGSSRRLAGIFYFKDMAVMKVMFTALITAMLGLNLFVAAGLIDPATQIYYMKTYYGAHILGGLLFGIGFVMSGWCPGTAAVGLASGKLDALVFLVGAIIGSIAFNELFPLIKPLYTWIPSQQQSFGEPGLAFVHESLGFSKSGFALLFTLAAVLCFWAAEWIERLRGKRGLNSNAPFLKAFSLGLIIFAVAALLFPVRPVTPPATASTPHPTEAGLSSEKEMLAAVAAAEDHMEPEELADRLFRADPALVVIDVRPPEEYGAFHIRGAVNVPLPELPDYVAQHADKAAVVLYSNGMTHPAQARDALFRMGYGNVYILTDGLTGFVARCLKPVSLRTQPVSEETAAKINTWRAYFSGEPAESVSAKALEVPEPAPGLIETTWLAENLTREGIRVIDVRAQPDYNREHIPGSLSISCESFRGSLNGVPSVLMPASILSQKLSFLGISPGDFLILIYDKDRVRDATLAGMAFERVGHQSYALLNGGFDKWMLEGKPVDTLLPSVSTTRYPAPEQADRFTVGYEQVLSHVTHKSALILDTRPGEYFTGKKSDEARAGRIPGAVNRPYGEDILKSEGFSTLRHASELEAVYAGIIPSKEALVVVHCRTGHQASQTYFVLKHLLGYKNVFWYDAGWTEWAARRELPIETG